MWILRGCAGALRKVRGFFDFPVVPICDDRLSDRIAALIDDAMDHGDRGRARPPYANQIARGGSRLRLAKRVLESHAPGGALLARGVSQRDKIARLLGRIVSIRRFPVSH